MAKKPKPRDPEKIILKIFTDWHVDEVTDRKQARKKYAVPLLQCLREAGIGLHLLQPTLTEVPLGVAAICPVCEKKTDAIRCAAHSLCTIGIHDANDEVCMGSGQTVAIQEDENAWTNSYRCPCGQEWDSCWSCTCNEKCPNCNKEIEPSRSKENATGYEINWMMEERNDQTRKG